MLKGKAIKYGNNVDTDVIIPARYLNLSDIEALTAHCMEDLDKSFMTRVKPGDVMVAGKNFGCGSSREHAPLVIKASGINCIVAETFARIFYRNAINIGLPILECPEAVEGIAEGDDVTVDIRQGMITNHTKNQSYQSVPFPDFMVELIEAQGLINYVKSNLEKEAGVR